jgi:A/G-specific adenine glycosylase
VERCQGKVPSRWDDLIRLPGIGDYTAGAILSIAFGQPLPAVDGNVRRILCRLFAVRQPLKDVRARQEITDLAQSLVPEKNAGRFNQALMDLGSKICTPRKPNCERCPVRKSCKAYQENLQDLLPMTLKRGPLPHSHVTAGILRDKRGRVLVVKRPGQGLLGGLWKFPGGPRSPDESLKHSLQKRAEEELGIQVRVGKSMATVRHAYTHFRITLHAFKCTLQDGRPKALACDDWQWVKPARLSDFAFSKADRQIALALEGCEP